MIEEFVILLEEIIINIGIYLLSLMSIHSKWTF